MADGLKMLGPSIAGGLGAQIDDIDVLVIPRSGSYLRGSVMQADIGRVSVETTNALIADPASGFVNVIEPTAAGARGHSRHVVLLQHGFVGRLTWARLEGLAWILVAGYIPGPLGRPVIVDSPGTNHGKLIKGITIEDKTGWVRAAWNSQRLGQIYDPPISGGSSGTSGGSSGGPPGGDTPVDGGSTDLPPGTPPDSGRGVH